jgi:acyl-CoA thioesterase-1
MGKGLDRNMGTWNSKVKGIELMILEFYYYLFTVIQPRRCRSFLRLITIVFVGAAIPPIAEQVVKSSVAAQRPVLMILGDSLVAGHGLPQGEAFPDILGQFLQNDGFDVNIINAGVSGDTTAGGLARLDWSLADNPDAAIIVLGGNDLLRGLDPSASFANLDKIIERLKARNIAVLLAGMQAPRNLGADYADEFDAIYQRLANRHDVLFYPFFLDGVALQPMMNLADGMHPNQAGVSHIALKILPQVKRLLSKVAQ